MNFHKLLYGNVNFIIILKLSILQHRFLRKMSESNSFLQFLVMTRQFLIFQISKNLINPILTLMIFSPVPQSIERTSSHRCKQRTKRPSRSSRSSFRILRNRVIVDRLVKEDDACVAASPTSYPASIYKKKHFFEKTSKKSINNYNHIFTVQFSTVNRVCKIKDF